MLFPDFCEVNMFITQNLLLITFFDNYLKKKMANFAFSFIFII